MKQIISAFILIVAVIIATPAAFVSCTDVAGNGVDSVYYSGSTLAQDSSYRNPVWEPDLELGAVFAGPSNYIAIGSETQWATGLTYCAPTLLSTDLMSWTFNSNTAFNLLPDTIVSGTDTTIYVRPKWAEGRLHSITAGFAKTIPTTSYWLFYQLGDTQAIGVSCAKAPQGPYLDFGKLLDTSNTGSTKIKDPFFYIVGTKFYLMYSTEGGSFAQVITLKKSTLPVLKGTPIKLSGATFTDVAIVKKGTYFYLFGTVANGENTEIRYGRSLSAEGPFVDKDGNNLLTGNGTILIQSGDQLINPQNVCGLFSDATNMDFILYNATDKANTTLKNGFNRRPLLLNALKATADGWFDGVVTPVKGWTLPKFTTTI